MLPSISLSEYINIPTYYLVISLAVCIGIVWIYFRAPRMGLSRALALDLCLIVMVASFVGARAFHILYENFPHYQEAPLRVLYFWEGGFVYYGGALLAALSAAIFLFFKSRNNFEAYFDLFAPVMSLSYILGRVACFLTGCCYGQVCELPWAIEGRHPTQLYAVLWELGTFLIVMGVDRTAMKNRPRLLRAHGALFYGWVILHALGRLIMEQFRDDFRGPSLGLSISSWISVGVIGLATSLLLKKR